MTNDPWEEAASAADTELWPRVVSAEAELAVLAFAGELDIESSVGLRTIGVELIEDGHCHLVLDLSKLTFIDSSGLNALVHLRSRALEREGSIRLAVAHPRVGWVLRSTGLDQVFAVYPSVGEALAARQ
jgi:anti-sigma B factor antagonist